MTAYTVRGTAAWEGGEAVIAGKVFIAKYEGCEAELSHTMMHQSGMCTALDWPEKPVTVASNTSQKPIRPIPTSLPISTELVWIYWAC